MINDGSIHPNRFLTPSQSMESNRLSAWELNQVRICACRRCPRLVSWRAKTVARYKQNREKDDYWDNPVSGFGDPFARLMVLGLAPSASGSNRTGRLFTGDASGDFLFSALFQSGFANRSDSSGFGDEIWLTDVYLASVGRCAAPQNKPRLSELDTCQGFLEVEIALLDRLEGIVVLGHVAFELLLTLFRNKHSALPAVKFAHGAYFHLDPRLPWILCSYHPSHQNTQTGRLTQEMFTLIWKKVLELLGPRPAPK